MPVKLQKSELLSLQPCQFSSVQLVVVFHQHITFRFTQVPGLCLPNAKRFMTILITLHCAELYTRLKLPCWLLSFTKESIQSVFLLCFKQNPYPSKGSKFNLAIFMETQLSVMHSPGFMCTMMSKRRYEMNRIF